MALQKKILKREITCSDEVDGVTKTFTLSTATLAGGIPGKIYDVAYGPVVHTGSLSAEAEIGTYVDKRGVIINAPEYALVGGLTPSLKLPANTVVNFMTAGHVWIKSSEYGNVIGSGKMAGRKLFGPDPFDKTGITAEYASGTAYALNAKFWRKDINEIKTYYKVTTAIEASANTGWDAMIANVTRLGADGDMMVVEVNGFDASTTEGI